MARKSFNKKFANYTTAITVVHGESEELFVKYIKACLRLNIYIHSRTTSIQINGLMHELETNFTSVSKVKNNDKIEVEIKKEK